MINIMGYSAWRDKNCFDTVSPRMNINDLKIQNRKFRGICLTDNIDNKYETDTPMYDAGHTLIHSKFSYNVFDTIIKEDYSGINKIIISRWIPAEENWATVKIYEVTSNSWEQVNIEVIRSITQDTVMTSQVLKYKIEYYKWENNASMLQKDMTQYLEIDYQLQSNFISDKDECFPLFINVQINQERVQDSNLIHTLTGQYPIFIKNTATNYNQGSFKAMLMTEEILNRLRQGKGYDLESQQLMIDFKKRILNFLTNGKPKCIRMLQGELFVVNIIGNVQIEWVNFGNGYQCQISFNWAEIANGDSTEAVERIGLNY